MEPQQPSGDSQEQVEERASRSIQILHEDPWLVAVHKPAGWLVHRVPQMAKEDPVLLQQVRDQIGKRLFPVHRLDRPTSGVLVFALDKKSAAHLVDQFTRRTIRKRYLALVRGYLTEEGTIEIPLRERFGEEAAGYTLDCHPLQTACTQYRAIRWFEAPWGFAPFASSRYCFLTIEPRTGRWHQIRRHLQHIAHPIIGDKRHGDSRHNRHFADHLGNDQLLLSASRIEMIHPQHQTPIAFEAPLDSNFERILSALAPFEVSQETALAAASSNQRL
ncbi:MAG: pseudouridine synthase [Pirellulaceae bacterium]|jgi:tRNA pseudouridine65 synthase